MANPKVVVIGLDGMTPQLVEPWMKEGKLPNLARIAQEGAYGRLLSTMPPSSPQAWSSFLTGKNPGKHGIFGFDHRKPGTYTWALTTSRDRVGPDLGQIISARGGSAGFLFVPLTYPPYPVNGFMVSGMGTPGPKVDFTFPIELKRKLMGKFDPNQVFVESPVTYQDPVECFEALERSIAHQYAIYESLVQEFDDLSCEVVVFVQPDRVQHFGWHYMDPSSPLYSIDLSGRSAGLQDAILRIYRRLDEVVGRVMERLDPNATLIIMSDHGAGPYDKFVDLNAWLLQEGYLCLLDSSGPSLDSSIARLYSVWQVWGRKVIPFGFRKWLKERLSHGLKARLESEKQNPVATRIDWSRTRAFSEGIEGLITLNVEGREPHGVVSPGKEREELIEEIAQRLSLLRDMETGFPVVERVWRREEIYEGAALEQAPDLILAWHGERYYSKAIWNAKRNVFWAPDQWRASSPLTLSGCHRREGVIFAKGPSVATGAFIQGAEIIDVAPTVLALMGLPLLPDFDGKVLQELTVGIEGIQVEKTEGGLQSIEPEVYSEEEAKQVEDLLRGLGYIE
jgi:predicted AlkP superfamily phosphohydrolase/phosphomutase